MPLFDPTHTPDVAPEDAVVVVHRFLERCREWAVERELPKRVERVAASLDPDDAAGLHAWVVYLRFTEHTLRELEGGTLDRWFVEPTPD